MRSKLHMGCSVVSALAAVVLFGANAFAADPIKWDIANGLAIGNGCNSTGMLPDAWLIANGNFMSVLFTNMGVDLTPATAANTATTGCLVRVPVEIASDTFIDQLEQTLNWGYAKDLATIGKLAVSATFCGQPATPIIETVDGTVFGVEPLKQTSTTSVFVHGIPPACQGAPMKCLFQANLAVDALRPLPSQDISIRIYGEDIEYDALLSWKPFYPPCY